MTSAKESLPRIKRQARTDEPGEVKLIDGKVVLRPDHRGEFDELLLMDGEECLVHAEMMDRDRLWIGIYPRGETTRRVCMWISIIGRKLSVHADED